MKRRVLSMMLVLMLMLVYSIKVFADQTNITTNQAKSLTIIHTNDVHARVIEDDTCIGYGKVAALARDLQLESGLEPIIVDAGDALHGQPIATIEHGESIVNIMNKVGYDVMVPGNHDFNYGQDRLLELAKKASFKMISANIIKSDGTKFLDDYTIIERNGIKVAFFGISTPETAYMTNPNNVVGLNFGDPVKTAESMVSTLKDKADVIVCLAHLGLNEASKVTSKVVAEKVPGIDLIIDGHSHTAFSEPLKVKETLIVQTGEYLKNIGTVKIGLDANNKVTGITASLFTKEQSNHITAQEDVVAAIDHYSETLKKSLSEVILKSQISFDGERAHVRTGPTNLSCLITSAMLYTTGADIALINGGAIRDSIAAGPVTRGDILRVLPFSNYIVTKRMKGSEIKLALEHGLSNYPNANGAFLQVANVEYRFDETKPVGNRIIQVWVKGVKLDLHKEYIVAISDFLAANGDGYSFSDLPLVNEYQALDEALIAYVTENIDAIRYEKYIIHEGDVLWKIARKTGHSSLELAHINKLENPDKIFAGEFLLVPAWK